MSSHGRLVGKVILECVVGSSAHGTSVDDGLEDLDLMRVVIEEPRDAIGFDPSDTLVCRTKPDGVRSEAGDVDLTAYSLRKYLRLALRGNPTILLALFAKPRHITQEGENLRALAPYIVSKQAFFPFRGYMRQQLERLMGTRGQKNVTRPELVEKYGYDCYAADTEFLTETGWKRYDEITDEKLGTVNPTSGELEFQAPLDRVKKPYTGPMFHGKTRYSEWLVTANHRMWVSPVDRGPGGTYGDAYVRDRANWEFRSASTVTTKRWHQRVAATPRKGDFNVSDSYLKLIGAYVSEGCVGKRLRNGRASVLRFEQKDAGALHSVMAGVEKEFTLRRYRYAEKRLVTTFTLADRAVAAKIENECGSGSANKRLPPWFVHLSARQALVLLDALMAGDGTRYRTGGEVYYTISSRLADDVQALAFLAGRRSLIWGPYEGGMLQVFVHEHNGPIAVFKGSDVTQTQATNVEVVCFTVPNEILVTRRNGRVAVHGNTKYAGHIIRLGLQGVELLRTGRMSLPMEPHQRRAVLDVRTGMFTFEHVVEFAAEIEKDLVAAYTTSTLREEPDTAYVERWMIRQYLDNWGRL